MLSACAVDEIDRLYAQAHDFVARGPANSDVDVETRLQRYPEYLTKDDFRSSNCLPLEKRRRLERRKMENDLVSLLHRKCSEDTFACAVRALERLDFSCRQAADRASCKSVRRTRDPRLVSIKDPHDRQSWSVIVERAEKGATITAHAEDLAYEWN
jgi:hypothetical protein